MTDTAQPLAAETDPVANAAEAFKISLGQTDAPERPRDERGRFASEAQPEQAEVEDDEIEPGEPDTGEPDDTEEEAPGDDEAAEEAQPSAAAMPSSWAKEDAEMWSALPPEAQAKIAEREGQRDAAVNRKFQEAANLTRANEAIIREAANNRDRFAQLAEVVMQTIRPVEPPLSMLDYNSDDYDPDAYHLKRAQFEQQSQWLHSIQSQQQEAAQAREGERDAAEQAQFQQINAATRDQLLADVPELGDPAKAQATFNELIEYAVKSGAPVDLFKSPTTALEWHVLWKAREYDKQQAAKARVGKAPPPEPKKAPPALRPGVATPRSAAKHARMAKDIKRLNDEGSIEAGAAVWKHLLKG